MSQFHEENLELFLGVVRKYMQVRGSLSQKELAELTDVGVSTMSRFLNKKTNELNAQLIAKIVAKLKIPLHEVIDFVEEEFTEQFMRLVRFYREEGIEGGSTGKSEELDDGLLEQLEDSSPGATSTAQRDVKAKIKVGGKTQTVSFQSEGGSMKDKSVSEKMADLSPRQKAYLQDFLNLDMEGRDLIVDLGNNLFRYFRQKGMDL